MVVCNFGRLRLSQSIQLQTLWSYSPVTQAVQTSSSCAVPRLVSHRPASRSPAAQPTTPIVKARLWPNDKMEQSREDGCLQFYLFSITGVFLVRCEVRRRLGTIWVYCSRCFANSNERLTKCDRFRYQQFSSSRFDYWKACVRIA